MYLRSLPLLVLGLICRPLWRQLTRNQATKVEKNQGYPEQAQGALYIRNILLYEQRSAWIEVLPWIGRIESPKRRMGLAHAFALLYLHNRRLEEAIEAATYWVSVAEQWVREHPEDAREALSLHKRLRSWYLRPEQSEGKACVWGEEAYNALVRLNTLRGMFKDYRDARVALAMLRWVKKKGDGKTVPVPFKSRRKEINPLIPFRREFDYELATRLGITDEEFDRMCEDAEKM